MNPARHLGSAALLAAFVQAGCGSAPPAPTGAAQPSVTLFAPARPLMQGGQTHLVYELVIHNPTPGPLELVEVVAQPRARARLVYAAAALERITTAVPSNAAPRVVPPLARAIVYLWETLADPSQAGAPIDVAVGLVVEGAPQTLTLVVQPMAVAPIVLQAPLVGEGWFAANAPTNESPHRRSIQRLDDGLWTAQRYAIDFVRVLGPEGTHRGDPLVNASYAAYGADVMAMAAGTVVAVIDGIPENVPGKDSRAVPIDYQTLAGNAVVIQHAADATATYAHLVPGSIKVAKGDEVTAGTVLGKVGNSGNSSEPHLHLHVCDRASLLACHGVPYAFDAFVEVAIIIGPNDAPRSLPPVIRQQSLPIDKSWLTLGPLGPPP